MQNREFRSSITTQGRRMAGARALWRATGMKTEDFQKPIIAIANSFTQFVPGHVHLHQVGRRVKQVIDARKQEVQMPFALEDASAIPQRPFRPTLLSPPVRHGEAVRDLNQILNGGQS